MVTRENIEKVNKCIAMIKNGSYDAIIDLYSLMSNTIRFIAIRYLKNPFDSDCIKGNLSKGNKANE